MRKNHVIGGLITFGLGLFLAYLYSPQVVEVIKGSVQPIFIIIGLLALAAAIFGESHFKKINYAVATAFLCLGLYGLYDEYYAVLDFLSGFFPPALILAGLVGVAHGIKVTKQS
ncbi:MAG: hypothetical protein HQK58_17150 [Deltaproteobacteria bacterium]|nr:hypothetical protein [Deltaproteobacteria bacterium]MBF0551452.1 hypothetical protein [Deltaproteobacteria bacterium]